LLLVILARVRRSVDMVQLTDELTALREENKALKAKNKELSGTVSSGHDSLCVLSRRSHHVSPVFFKCRWTGCSQRTLSPFEGLGGGGSTSSVYFHILM
jgi:hypothetical protein